MKPMPSDAPTGTPARKRERGSALWIVAAAVVMLAGLGLALTMTTHSTSRETRGAEDEIVAFYVAEGAVAEAYAVLADGGRPALNTLLGSYPRTLDGVTYSVDVTYGDADAGLGDDLTRLVGTAERRAAAAHVELLLRSTTGVVVSASLFGDASVALGDASMVDSYDSSLGTYASQAVNSHGSNTYADALAPVGSNSDIDLTHTSSVYGDAVPGPSGTTTVGGSAYVAGSTAPAATTTTLPAVTVPSLTSAGNFMLSGSSVQTITPGSYRYHDFIVKDSSKLTIEGPVTLVVHDADFSHDANVVIDSSGGPVEIYVEDDWSIRNNAVMKPADGDPNQLAVHMANTTDTQFFKDSSQFIGKVYAPQTDVDVSHSAEFWGGLVGENVNIRNDAKVHVDLNLPGVGTAGSSSFTQVAWRPLSPVQAEAITGP